MRPAHKMIAATLLLCLLVLVACSPSGESLKSSPGTESSDAAAELARLVDIDASAAPSGPSVGELISVEDFNDILGRDDLTFAPAL